MTGSAALITAVVALAGLWPDSDADDGDRSATPAATTTRAAADTTKPASTAPTTAGTANAGDVLRRGEVTLMDNENFDFETGLVSNGVANDIYLGGIDPDFGVLTTVRQAMVETPRAEKRAGCVEALSARRFDRLPHSELPAGTSVCITTEEGHVAALRIISPVAVGSPRLVFAYTVWR